MAGLLVLMSGCALQSPQYSAPDLSSAGHVLSPTRVVIQPEQLAKVIDSPDLILLHVGHGSKGFERTHLPGARYVDFREIMALKRDGRNNEMISPDQFLTLLQRHGIHPESWVVLYGDAAGVFPARLYVTMKHYGWADRVRILDGHLRGWIAQERAVQSGAEQAPSATTQEAHSPLQASPVPDVIVGDEQVRQAITQGHITFLDVRPKDQFTGEKRGPGVTVAGRIPGAINLPWRELITGVKPPWFVPLEEIRERLEKLKVTADRPVIVYDVAGMHASIAFVVLDELGYQTSLYDGGYESWSAAEPNTTTGKP